MSDDDARPNSGNRLNFQEVESAAVTDSKLSSKAVATRGQMQPLAPIAPEGGRPPGGLRPLAPTGPAAAAAPAPLAVEIEPSSGGQFDDHNDEGGVGSDREGFDGPRPSSSGRPTSGKGASRPSRGGRKYHDQYAENERKIAEAIKDTLSLIDRHDLKIATDHTQLKAINTVKNIVKTSGVQEKDKLNDKLFH